MCSTIIYDVSVDSTFRAPFDHFDRTGGAHFPGYREVPSGAHRTHSWFENPLHFHEPNPASALAQFEISTIDHTSFAAEWPITPDSSAIVAGFRRSVGLTQAAFAQAISVSRVSVERWESGKIRPFRGDSLELLTALRPLATSPLSAGQLLNAAAAVVLPVLKRPTATYSGAFISDLLSSGRRRHSDLAPALLTALIDSKILAPVADQNEGDLDAEYIALAGVVAVGRTEHSDSEDVLRVARSLSAHDRRLWIELGERLAHPQR